MDSSRTGLRTIATLEASKGAIVLLAATGLLAVVHEGAQAVAEEVVRHFHLNPASGYPRILIDAAASLTSARLWLLAAGSMLYAGVRWIEAYGLWRGRAWAEWFGAVSAAIYVPFEIYELVLGVTILKVFLLAINSAVLAVLLMALRGNRGRHRHLQTPQH